MVGVEAVGEQNVPARNLFLCPSKFVAIAGQKRFVICGVPFGMTPIILRCIMFGFNKQM
jgi:hypothetical protein